MNTRNHYLNIIIGLTILVISFSTACETATPVELTPAPQITTPSTGDESPSPEETPITVPLTDGNQWEVIETFSGQTSQTTSVFHISGIKWRINWDMITQHPELASMNLLIYRESEGDIPIMAVPQSGDKQSMDSYIVNQGNGNYYVKIIASNLDKWHITIEDHSIKALISPIQIIHIHHKGRSYKESIIENYDILEADEYIELKNTSDTPQKLAGWKVKNISRGIPPFIFPPSASRQYNSWLYNNIQSGYPSFPPPGHTPYSNAQQMQKAFKEAKSAGKSFIPFSPNTLAPYTSIRIYTGEYHLESGGFTFYYHPGDMWNNIEPDTAVLYNPQGEEASRRSYTVSDI